MLRPRSFAPRRAAPRRATDPSRPASVPSNLYCTSGCKAGTWRGRSNGAETLDWRWQGRRRDALAGRRRSRLARAWAGGGLIFWRVSPAATPQVRSREPAGGCSRRPSPLSTGVCVLPAAGFSECSRRSLPLSASAGMGRWRVDLAGRRRSQLAIAGLLRPQQCSARAASRRATPRHAIPSFPPRQFVFDCKFQVK